MTPGESDLGRDKPILRSIATMVLEAAPTDVSVVDVRVGVFYTGVKLSTGHGGMAYTPSEELPLDHSQRHSYMPAAGKLSGMAARDAVKYAFSDNLLESAVGLATVNALAEHRYAVGGGAYRTVLDADGLDLVGVRATDTLTMVGAFPFFIRKLRDQVARMYVTERNLNAFGGYPLTPADRQAEVLEAADIVVVTAAALGNHTLDEILALCRRARAIAIVGPTTPLCPEPMFSRGVTVVGGTHIPDADAMLKVVSEGGTGGHLWLAGAVKVNLMPG